MRELCKKVLRSFQKRNLFASGDSLPASEIIHDIADEEKENVIDAICELTRANFLDLDKEQIVVTVAQKGSAYLERL